MVHLRDGLLPNLLPKPLYADLFLCYEYLLSRYTFVDLLDINLQSKVTYLVHTFGHRNRHDSLLSLFLNNNINLPI